VYFRKGRCIFAMADEQRGGKPNPGTPADGRIGNKNAGPKKGSKKKGKGK
jgi:hypothetical protein